MHRVSNSQKVSELDRLLIAFGRLEHSQQLEFVEFLLKEFFFVDFTYRDLILLRKLMEKTKKEE